MGTIPFIGHNLLSPWVTRNTRLLREICSQLNPSTKNLGCPISLAAVSLATRVQPESSPSHSGTKWNPAGVSACFLLGETKRPPWRHVLLQHCQRSCQHFVSVEPLPSGHLRAGMLSEPASRYWEEQHCYLHCSIRASPKGSFGLFFSSLPFSFLCFLLPFLLPPSLPLFLFFPWTTMNTVQGDLPSLLYFRELIETPSSDNFSCLIWGTKSKASSVL